MLLLWTSLPSTTGMTLAPVVPFNPALNFVVVACKSGTLTTRLVGGRLVFFGVVSLCSLGFLLILRRQRVSGCGDWMMKFVVREIPINSCSEMMMMKCCLMSSDVG